MKTKAVTAAVSLALLAACAGQHTKLTDDHRKTLTEQPVHAIHVEPLGFMVESTGYSVAAVLFTPLVVAGQAAEGSDLRTVLGLEDPVLRVKERVLAAFEERYRLPSVARVAQPSGRLSADTQYKALSGVLLEVRTTKWGIDNNRAKYAAGVRVVRLADSVTLWDAACNEVVADKDKPSPAREALRADNGALLKAKLNQAADACGEQLAAWAIERAESR
jgi:hypothetical protein